MSGRNVVYVETRRKAENIVSSFLMTPAGLITTIVLIAVLLGASILFASWALPKFLELLMMPVVWGIGIFIGLLSVASRQPALTLGLSLLAGFAFWVVPTYESLQGIQQSWWSQLPLIGGLFATGATAISLPFIIISFVIFFLAFFVTSYASAFILGSLTK